MRVVQGATKFEILKKKIATGFARDGGGGGGGAAAGALGAGAEEAGGAGAAAGLARCETRRLYRFIKAAPAAVTSDRS